MLFVSAVENPESGSQESDCHDRPGLVSLDVSKQDRQGYAENIAADSQQSSINESTDGVQKQKFGHVDVAAAEHYQADGSDSVEKTESDDEQIVVTFE